MNALQPALIDSRVLLQAGIRNRSAYQLKTKYIFLLADFTKRENETL